MTQEHPFAQYVRILGKGRHGSRSLTQDEANTAMAMILEGQVEPIQLGAFLMLLRVKEESAGEVAGFVEAIRARMEIPPAHPTIDLDWSTYAGKRRHLPWFILSALLLASQGVRILMHGTEGHTPGRIYTRETLEALGLPIARNLTEASRQIEAHNFAYIPLQGLNPRLQEIIELRPLLGLRSPVHTVSRMLNPFQAPYSVQGIFHPGYRDIHQEAAVLLQQPHMAVFKGEGGEVERNPDQPCLAKMVREGRMFEEEWPAMFEGGRHLKDTAMEIDRLKALWLGEIDDEYGESAVIGTTAMLLYLLQRADDMGNAEDEARRLWRERSQVAFGWAA